VGNHLDDGSAQARSRCSRGNDREEKSVPSGALRKSLKEEEARNPNGGPRSGILPRSGSVQPPSSCTSAEDMFADDRLAKLDVGSDPIRADVNPTDGPLLGVAYLCTNALAGPAGLASPGRASVSSDRSAQDENRVDSLTRTIRAISAHLNHPPRPASRDIIPPARSAVTGTVEWEFQKIAYRQK
jgi:hypothetical protein